MITAAPVSRISEAACAARLRSCRPRRCRRTFARIFRRTATPSKFSDTNSGARRINSRVLTAVVFGQPASLNSSSVTANPAASLQLRRKSRKRPPPTATRSQWRMAHGAWRLARGAWRRDSDLQHVPGYIPGRSRSRPHHQGAGLTVRRPHSFRHEQGALVVSRHRLYAFVAGLACKPGIHPAEALGSAHRQTAGQRVA